MPTRCLQCSAVPISVCTTRVEGVIGDLIESASREEASENINRSCRRECRAFVHAICDDSVDRMILISHSQGTLITSVLPQDARRVVEASAIDRGAGAQKLSSERILPSDWRAPRARMNSRSVRVERKPTREALEAGARRETRVLLLSRLAALRSHRSHSQVNRRVTRHGSRVTATSSI